jgi:release factor glutamine methyltransferase
LLEVVRLSTRYLADHGSASPRLDAEVLTASALRIRRLDVYLQFDRSLSPSELSAVRDAIRRRAAGEPVAYITGRREFYTREFIVTPDVLVPRPETEAVVEIALRQVREKRAGDYQRARVAVADLGTGSGCIAVTLACEEPDLDIIATDVSDAALTVARMNAELHGVRDVVDFRQSSWADDIERKVDVVVGNPPYVTSSELSSLERDVCDFEPHAALDGGVDGLDAYRELLASVQRLPASPTVILEVDPRRAERVAALIVDALPASAVAEHPDLTGRTRVVAAVPPDADAAAT